MDRAALRPRRQSEDSRRALARGGGRALRFGVLLPLLFAALLIGGPLLYGMLVLHGKVYLHVTSAVTSAFESVGGGDYYDENGEGEEEEGKEDNKRKGGTNFARHMKRRDGYSDQYRRDPQYRRFDHVKSMEGIDHE